jgi:hypothetical protein
MGSLFDLIGKNYIIYVWKLNNINILKEYIQRIIYKY